MFKSASTRFLRRACFVAVQSLALCAIAQNPTPAPTPATTPAAQPQDWEKERTMTREERIKAHQAKIDKIIQENRKKQEEELAKQKEAAAAVATGTPVAGAPGVPGAPPVAGAPPVPGAPLPPGPVTAYQAPAPGVPGVQAGQPTAPKGARSEARSLMFFRPFDTAVNLGDTFATEVVADTKDGSADAVSFQIRYAPGIMNPLAIDHSAIDDYVKDEIDYYFDEQTGEIHMRFPLKEPQKLVSRKIVTIYWEAIAQTQGTEINLTFGEDRTTGLFLRGMNVLGTAPGARDGVINTTVMVRAPKAKTVVQKVGEKGLIISSSVDEAPRANMAMRLEPSKTSLRTDDEFFVDLVLENPDRSPVDRVKALIQFDPQVLEVVDYDRGNWIRQGINIYDGFAHEDFNFDFHRANIADNKRGFIVYEVASEIDPPRSTGSFARVRFKAKQPADKAEIRLVTSGKDGEPTTDISFLHQNLLMERPKGSGVIDSIALDIRKALPVAKSNGTGAKRGRAVGQKLPGAIEIR